MVESANIFISKSYLCQIFQQNFYDVSGDETPLVMKRINIELWILDSFKY